MISHIAADTLEPAARRCLAWIRDVLRSMSAGSGRNNNGVVSVGSRVFGAAPISEPGVLLKAWQSISDRNQDPFLFGQKNASLQSDSFSLSFLPFSGTGNRADINGRLISTEWKRLKQQVTEGGCKGEEKGKEWKARPGFFRLLRKIRATWLLSVLV